MTRDDVALKMRGAREFLTAYFDRGQLGDRLWQEIANDLGERWVFDALAAVAALGSSAVGCLASEEGDDPEQVLHRVVSSMEPSNDLEARRHLRAAAALMQGQLGVPRDPALINAAAAELGERLGVFALPVLADLGLAAAGALAEFRGSDIHEVMREQAVADEMSLILSGEA